MKSTLTDIFQMDALWIWLLCLLVMLAGPAIHIHHATPLQSWENRSLTLFVILAIWLISKILLLPNTRHQSSNDQTAYKIMRSHTYHMIKLAFNRLIKHRSITPIYLVIGNEGSGKSALIESFGAQTISATPWWQSNDTFFLEYEAEQSPTVLKKWLASIMRLVKPLMPIGGIIICLDIHKLYQSHSREQKQSLTSINTLLQMIHTTTQSYPITIVCTKSDLIAGFQPTFSDAIYHDDHCLGLSANLSELKDNIQTFIAKLYDFATTQTQQEHDFFNKQKIMDFPRQIDAIKEAIESIVMQIAHNTHATLNSLCFVSVIQKQQPIDYLAKPIEQSYHIHGQSHETMPSHHNYFANSLLNHVQSNGRATITRRHKRMTQWFALSTMVLLANVAFFHYVTVAVPAHRTIHSMIITHKAMAATTPQAMLEQLHTDIQSQSTSTLADLIHVLQANKESDRHINENVMRSSIDVIRQTMPAQLYQLAITLLAQNQKIDTNNADALYNQTAFDAFSHNVASQSVGLLQALIHSDHPTPLQAKQAQDSLMQTYLNHYVAHWDQQTHALTKQPPQTIQGAIQWLSNLSDGHSQWRQHMQLAYQQTKANQSPHFNKTVSDHFTWLQDWQQHDLAKAERHAANLSKALQQAQSAPNPDATMFSLSQQIALNPDQSSIGQMLQSHNKAHLQWIDDGIHHIWQLMLSKAAGYVNRQWLTVYQQVNPMIAKQFPFDPQAHTDITANQFTTIFKPNGILDRFFDLYLLAFTDQNKNYWHWKPLFGNTIPLHQDQLEQFIRAHLIQAMFFPPNQQSIGSTFSLTPLGLPDTIRTIRITLGNQSITYDQDAIPMMQLSWPGQSPYGINMQINQFNGVQVNYVKPGFWGLFHLIAKHSEYDIDQQQATITFKVNGETIHLLLSSKASPNPFIPDVLNQFRLQPKL